MGYPDDFFRISAEEARNMANRLCREEGIYCDVIITQSCRGSENRSERSEEGGERRRHRRQEGQIPGEKCQNDVFVV